MSKRRKHPNRPDNRMPTRQLNANRQLNADPATEWQPGN